MTNLCAAWPSDKCCDFPAAHPATAASAMHVTCSTPMSGRLHTCTTSRPRAHPARTTKIFNSRSRHATTQGSHFFITNFFLCEITDYESERHAFFNGFNEIDVLLEIVQHFIINPLSREPFLCALLLFLTWAHILLLLIKIVYFVLIIFLFKCMLGDKEIWKFETLTESIFNIFASEKWDVKQV